MPSVAASSAVRFRTLLRQMPLVPRAFRLVWEPSRGLTVAWLALVIAQGLLPAASVILTKRVIDALVHLIQSRGAPDDVRAFAIPAALMGLTLLAQNLFATISAYIRDAQAQATVQHIDLIVHRKSVSVDFAFYDSVEYYDRLHRARAEAASTPLQLLGSVGRLLQSVISLVTTGAVLATYAPWLPLIVVAGTLPGLFMALRHVFDEHELTVRQTTDNRTCWYYDDLLTSTQSAAEIRLFGIGEHYIARYQQLRSAIRSDRLGLMRRSVVSEVGGVVIAIGLMAATMAWMVAGALHGRYTLGDLALIYQAYGTGQTLLGNFQSSVGAVYRHVLYLGNLFEYLDMESSLKPASVLRPAPATCDGGIVFHDVTFAYPGSSRIALRRFNLTIGAGDAVAIVGENGAGKSTLSKLLCRFYDPQEGRITIDGVDIRDYPPAALREMFSVLFQQPVSYHESVSANIAVSSAHTVRDQDEIRRAARAAGAEGIIARLPSGYETVLGRMFKQGTELSTGEWQRIGLARAYLRQAPILILDEPTSAMDPWSEAEWLRQLRELERGRTTIIISHRFSIATHAARIHVMDAGAIVESGTHDELLARGGKYAAAWQTLMLAGA